jgi:hypothetical protein
VAVNFFSLLSLTMALRGASTSCPTT